MAVTTFALTPNQKKHLRPFDPRRDQNPVADLIELCFADNMDADGRRYLANMRAAARENDLTRWVSYTMGVASPSLSGFIWEEDQQVVGNLSLIPFFRGGKRLFLIANVAVHPDFRRRGIARALTIAALEKTRQRRARATWLQVRHDNPAALSLYKSMGFQERARRTTWHLEAKPHRTEMPGDIQVTLRKSDDWGLQHRWLIQNYPEELHWHLAFRMPVLQPGILGALYRIFTDTHAKHWCARKRGCLLGVLSHQTSFGYADRLWLAAPPEREDLAIGSLFAAIQRKRPSFRPLSLDYPANRAVEALHAVGLQPQHTLIWMETTT
jgi:ribosomal protein S18 acetylase RimI-like enzyme